MSKHGIPPNIYQALVLQWLILEKNETVKADMFYKNHSEIQTVNLL